MDGTRNCRRRPTPKEFLERICKWSLTHRRLKKGPFPRHVFSKSLLDITVTILNLAAAIPCDILVYFIHLLIHFSTSKNPHTIVFSIRDFSVLILFLSLLAAGKPSHWFEEVEVLLLLPKQPWPHMTWNAMGLGNTPQLI